MAQERKPESWRHFLFILQWKKGSGHTGRKHPGQGGRGVSGLICRRDVPAGCPGLGQGGHGLRMARAVLKSGLTKPPTQVPHLSDTDSQEGTAPEVRVACRSSEAGPFREAPDKQFCQRSPLSHAA